MDASLRCFRSSGRLGDGCGFGSLGSAPGCSGLDLAGRQLCSGEPDSGFYALVQMK